MCVAKLMRWRMHQAHKAKPCVSVHIVTRVTWLNSIPASNWHWRAKLHLCGNASFKRIYNLLQFIIRLIIINYGAALRQKKGSRHVGPLISYHKIRFLLKCPCCVFLFLSVYTWSIWIQIHFKGTLSLLFILFSAGKMSPFLIRLEQIHLLKEDMK